MDSIVLVDGVRQFVQESIRVATVTLTNMVGEDHFGMTIDSNIGPRIALLWPGVSSLRLLSLHSAEAPNFINLDFVRFDIDDKSIKELLTAFTNY